MKYLKQLIPYIFIVAVVLLFFYPVWLQRKTPLPADFVVGVYYPWLDYKWGYPAGVPVKNVFLNDVASFVYPVQTLFVDIIKKGSLPFWNPYIFAGTPLLADFQSAVFSLLPIGWSVAIISQHLFSGIFTYLLLRYWKVSKAGSVLGSIVYSFSGYHIIFSQWNGHVMAASFVPLLLLLEERFIAGKKYLFGVGISLILFLQILSGYPQIVYYTLLAMGVLLIYRTIGKKVDFRIGLGLGLFILLGIMLSAFQILPGWELYKLSQRTIEPVTFDWVFLHWDRLITFLAPDYFGNPATGNYWSTVDYFSNIGFVGVGAFILSLLSLSVVKKKREVVFCLLLIFVSLVLSLPTPVSLFLWKKSVLGFNATAAHRALVLFNFAIACLAAFGADVIGKLTLKKNKFVIAFSFLLPFLILFIFAVYAISLDGKLMRGINAAKVALRNLVIPGIILSLSFLTVYISGIRKKNKIITTVLLGFLIVFELFYFGWKYTPFSPSRIVFPETPVLKFLKEQPGIFRVSAGGVIPVNMLMAYKTETLEGYEAMYPLRMAKFIAALNSGNADSSPMTRYGVINNDTSRLLDLVNTRFYLTLKKDEKKFKDQPKFKPAFADKSVAVWENRSALPRAFMVYDWEVVKNDDEILTKLLSKDFPYGKKIILEQTPSIKITKARLPAGQVTYVKYKEQESEIGVETDRPGMLFVSDAYYPGWKAWIDGVETKIYRANYAFRAIEVPSGKHLIKFIYQPKSFSNGLKISGISLIILIVFCLYLARIKQHGNKRYGQ